MIRSAFSGLLDAYLLLSRFQRKRFKELSVGMVVNTFFDLFSLVSLLPILLIVLNQSNIDQNGHVQYVYHGLGFSNHKSFTVVAILLVLFLFFLKTLYAQWIIKRKTKFTSDLTAQFIKDLYLQVFHNNVSQSVGVNLNNITYIPFTFSEKIIDSFFDLISRIVLMFMVVSGLIIYDFKVFFYLSIVLVPTILLFFLFQKRTLKNVRDKLKVYHPAIMQKSVEVMEGRIEILFSGNKKKFNEAFFKLNKSYNHSIATLAIAINISSKTVELMAISGICVLFLYFTWFEKAEDDMLLILSIYTVAAYKLIPTLNGLNVAHMNLNVHKYVTEILKQQHQSSVTSQLDDLVEIEFREEIRFSNICFSYRESKFALEKVNFNIKKGQKIAIVGKSGSGKSTIVQLLLRVLIENSGDMFVDDKKMNEQFLHSWGEKVSYVPQSVFVFEGSIIENISMLAELTTTDRKRIDEVINLLGLFEMIQSFPNGLDSLLEEKGKNISTGQRQRLGIARALMQNRDILIFDEVTSNLDETNQQLALETILRISQLNKTVIFVTHQKEIMDICDKIIEVKSGHVEVVESDFS